MSNIILPPKPLEPAIAPVLAERLHVALATLEEIGLDVHPAGRLPQAVRLLRDIGSKDAYPVDESELTKVGNAIKAAFNFVRIIGAIKPPGPSGVIASLKRALNGTLADVGPTEAHQAQSELFFGAALVSGGLLTATPDSKRSKTPDYVADIDTLRYSVEVKRPASANSIEHKVGEAVRQAREYQSHPIVIVLDLSDTLPEPVGISDISAAERDNKRVFDAGCRTASEYIQRRTIAEDAGYSETALLFNFAESLLWTQPTQSGPIPESSVSIVAEVFRAACAGLILDQSHKLVKRIMQGFQEVVGAFRELNHRI